MTRLGRSALVILACAAMLLPWERCHAACHDRLVTPAVPHACHDGDCHDDEGPPLGEVDHGPVDLLATAPRAQAAGPQAVALGVAWDETTSPAPVPSRPGDPEHRRRPPAPPLGVVRLL